MNRRTFLQGVLSLAVLGPLARAAVTEEKSPSFPRVTGGPGWVCIQNAESDNHWLDTLGYVPGQSQIIVRASAPGNRIRGYPEPGVDTSPLVWFEASDWCG